MAKTRAISSNACRRVLVVEDDADSAAAFKMLLERDGHHVELALTGEEALAVARSFQPDIVLCDLGLPGTVDGFGVASAIREDPAFSRPYLVAVTGRGFDADMTRVMEAGFNRHVLKPAEPQALRSLVASIPAARTATSVSGRRQRP